MRIRVYVSVVVLVIAGAVWQFYSPLGEIVREKEFEGIIRKREYLPRGYTNTWVVTSSDIKEMEARLREYVRNHEETVGSLIASELARYRRYYYGLINTNGERMIVVTAEHRNSPAHSRWDWQFSGVLTIGGGVYNWRIRYNKDVNEFDGFFCFQ